MISIIVCFGVTSCQRGIYPARPQTPGKSQLCECPFFVLEGLEVFFAIYPSYIERPPFSLRGDMGLLRPDTETSQPQS